MNLPKRSAFAAASVAFALATPGAANAAVTVNEAGPNLTVTGDAADDGITITAAGGFLVVNGTPTAVPSDGTAVIAVNAGDGRDSVVASGIATAYTSLTVDGGGGDDVVTGAGKADQLTGGDGDDRVTGDRGNDTMLGGAGNDVLVWNNGDGSDVANGEAGNDGVEVNGSPNAGDVLKVKAENGRTRLDRTNLGLFFIDADVERLAVNGLGGDDDISAAGAVPAALTFDGGTGADELTGGDGGDLLLGGESTDTLDGGGGGDRVVGDRGNDTMRGGAGDDVLVWNNGDNNDVIDGGDGVDRTEVNGAAAGDAFTVAKNGARTTFDRTNLVPFRLDVDTEQLEANGLAGDDTLSAGDGLALQVHADGGQGNDTLTTGDSADTLLGGGGNDTLNAGGGSDTADGQQGDDTVTVRDGAKDRARGGEGTDTVTADLDDVLDTFEAADVPATPAAPPAAPPADVKAIAARLTKASVKRKKNSVKVPVQCPAAEAGGCKGTVTLVRGTRILGTARFTLKAGQTRDVTVRLRGVGKARRVAAKAQVLSSDAAGNLAQSQRKLTIAR